MVTSISEQSCYAKVLLFKVHVYALPLIALQIAATVKNPPPQQTIIIIIIIVKF